MADSGQENLKTVIRRLDEILEEAADLKAKITRTMSERRAADQSIPQRLGTRKPTKRR
jgi:hypothetical protein